MTVRSVDRTLLVAGAILFLLGLLQGAVVQNFLNPRMALSAHLTAVQSGMALMVAGLAWKAVSLGPRIAALARWAIVLGMYGLWAGITLSATNGASDSLPIAGAGYQAAPAGEALVSLLVLGSSGLMTAGWAGFVAGLLRRRSD